MTEGSSRHRRIRLVTGPPGAGPGGIEESFVEAVSALKAADRLRPITVLTGSNPLRAHLARLLAIRFGGHANIRFLLLRDLARELGTAWFAGRGRRRLPEFGRDLLLREAIRPWAHGTYFHRIAGREGFLEVIGATLRDLKEGQVEPAALRATGAALRPRRERPGSARSDLLAGKMEDLANLYEAYDDLLRDRRFYDDEDLMKAAAAAAVTPGEAAPAALVYGFYDLNGLQRALIREWLAFREGTVFVPHEPPVDGDDLWEFGAPLRDWMASWISDRVALRGNDGGPARDRAETIYVSAPGEGREALEAVRWLCGIARERSFPFGHLGLLYRSPEPYLNLLPEIFERASVPWYGAEGPPIGSSQAARALLLLLEAGRSRLSRRVVLEALSVGGEPRASEWDRLSREAGVTAGSETWTERLARLSAPSASRLARRAEELAAALDRLPAQGSWADFSEAAADLAEDFVSGEAIRAPLVERLAGLSALDAVDTPVDRERFQAVLTQALSTWRARDEANDRFQRSGIFVGSVMEARLLSFHAVAIVGMVEKGFPAPPRQDPILLDEERERINAMLGADRLPLKAARHREERLLFRMARASAEEALALFYPRLETAGARPRLPSPFLLALEEQLSGKPTGYADLEASPRMRRVRLAALAPDSPSAAIDSREYDLAILQAAVREGAAGPAARRIASFLHGQPLLHRALQAEEARWEASRFTAHDGVVMKASLLEDLARFHPLRGAAISPSAIETFARCPLKYLFSRVFRLAELDDPEEGVGVDPIRRGTLMHRILESLYIALDGRGWLPLRPERVDPSVRLLRELATALFAVEERSAPVGYPLLWEIEKRRIVRDLERVLRDEAAAAPGWRPAYFELPFGPGAETPSAPVALEGRFGQSIPLKGRIDRVDVSADGATLRVTDYKSGKLPGEAALTGGTRVQLPLYMVAAEQALAAAHPGIRATVARYLSVSERGGFREVAYDAAALERDRPKLAEILATVLREIERGHFFAYPDDGCRWCEFQLACGEGREARFARKRDDRIAAEYLAMREEPA